MVTGSSKGIGRAVAEHLARAGARVVISSRKAEPCEAVASSLSAEGCEAVAIPCHVGRAEDVERLVAETRRRLGPIDILVANAAANPYYGPLLDIPEEAYHKTMDTNVLSTLRLCRLVREDMAAQGGGSVILVSSVGGIKATPNLGAYGVSKAADIQLARSLAAELGGQGIRVNCLLPGLVKTDFARALWERPGADDEARRGLPLQRLGEPEDIGPAAVFLASPASRWMTGQVLVIDGGATIVQSL